MPFTVQRVPNLIETPDVSHIAGTTELDIRKWRHRGIIHDPAGRGRKALYDLDDLCRIALVRRLIDAGISANGAGTLAAFMYFPLSGILERLPGVSIFPGYSLDDAEREIIFSACDRGPLESRWCYFALPELPDVDPRVSAKLLASPAELDASALHGLLINFDQLAGEMHAELNGDPLVSYLLTEGDTA